MNGQGCGLPPALVERMPTITGKLNPTANATATATATGSAFGSSELMTAGYYRKHEHRVLLLVQ